MERIPEAILFDPEYINNYIAVRVDHTEDGKRIGKIIASGQAAEDVFVALRQDQQENRTAQYYFSKPATEVNERDGWFVSVEAEDLVV